MAGFALTLEDLHHKIVELASEFSSGNRILLLSQLVTNGNSETGPALLVPCRGQSEWRDYAGHQGMKIAPA